MHAAAIENEGIVRGILLTITVTIATVILPAALAPILRAGGIPPGGAPPCLSTARARAVVFFALRYGILVATCGFMPLLDAVIYFHLLVAAVPRFPPSLIQKESDCFLSVFTVEVYACMAAVRVATLVTQENALVTSLPRAGLALGVLIGTNHVLGLLGRIGRGVGSSVARQAQAILGSGGVEAAGNVGRETVVEGLIGFSVWVCFLGSVIVA